MKNKYIYDEEVEQLIKNLPIKHKDLDEIILLIYNEGYSLYKALEISKHKISRRTAQRVVKRYSGGKINFRDLKNAYVYNVPKNLFNMFKKRNGSKKRDVIKPRLRWEILSINDFKCVKCGRSSKEIILHVDHIIPISRGGKTEKSNLQSLCSECNFGKGNNLE